MEREQRGIFIALAEFKCIGAVFRLKAHCQRESAVSEIHIALCLEVPTFSGMDFLSL